MDLQVTRDGQPIDAQVFFRLRPDVRPTADTGPVVGFAATVDLPSLNQETPARFGLEARLADGSVHRAHRVAFGSGRESMPAPFRR